MPSTRSSLTVLRKNGVNKSWSKSSAAKNRRNVRKKNNNVHSVVGKLPHPFHKQNQRMPKFATGWNCVDVTQATSVLALTNTQTHAARLLHSHAMQPVKCPTTTQNTPLHRWPHIIQPRELVRRSMKVSNLSKDVGNR